MAAVACGARARRPPAREAVEAFSHGMTVATNALLEGRGARTALIATEGFTDIVALGRQNRAQLYRLCATRPAPLVPPELRFAAPERMTPDGPLKTPTEAELDDLAARVAAARPESVAVVLLHSYRHPEHEQAIAEAIAQALPGRARLALARGRRHVPRVRAGGDDGGGRGAVAAARALPADGSRTGRARTGLPEPAIMQSNGGLIDLAAAAGPRRLDRALGARRRRRRRRVRRASRRARPTCCASTWAAPPATSASSTAALCRSAAPARSRSGRWRCRCSRCTPSAPAAARSRGAIRAARCASARARPGPTRARRATAGEARSRRSPTRIWCSDT